jgi:hypothetical protein
MDPRERFRGEPRADAAAATAALGASAAARAAPAI